MDAFLIKHLENLMMKSPISPYAIARFLCVGICFAVVVQCFLSPNRNWVSYADVLVFWSASLYDYQSSVQIERQNAKGFLNQRKAGSVNIRYVRYAWLFVSLLQMFTLMSALDLYTLMWSAVIFFVTINHYLLALNWTKPPDKQVSYSSWSAA